jgi:hypothetical protein
MGVKTLSSLSLIVFLSLTTSCINTNGLEQATKELKEAAKNIDPLRIDDIRKDQQLIADLKRDNEKLKVENAALRKGEPLPDLTIATDARPDTTVLYGDEIGEVTSFKIPPGARLTEIRVCSGNWVTGFRFSYSDGTFQAWGVEKDDRVEATTLGQGEYLANIVFREGSFVDWMEFNIHGGDKPRTVHLGRPAGESGYWTRNLEVKPGYKVVGLNFYQHKDKYFAMEGMNALTQPLR